MRTLLCILLLTVMSIPVIAQKNNNSDTTTKVGFSDITLNKVGTLELNFKIKNTLQAMRNGVDITIKGETPEEDMKILADTILFDYASKEDTQPSTMKLSGNVHIENGDLLIDCSNATINIGTQEAHFMNVSRIKHPSIGVVKTDELLYNLETGDIVITNLEAIDPKDIP